MCIHHQIVKYTATIMLTSVETLVLHCVTIVIMLRDNEEYCIEYQLVYNTICIGIYTKLQDLDSLGWSRT